MPLTYFYAQLFGIILLLLSLAMLLNRKAMVEIVREFINNRSLLFLAALMSLFLGIIVVETQNLWNGLLPSIVSLIGWIMIVRGALILFLPHNSLRRLFASLKFEQSYFAFALIMLVVGIYLTWSGFSPF